MSEDDEGNAILLADGKLVSTLIGIDYRTVGVYAIERSA